MSRLLELYESILASLRAEVRNLEENELVDRTLLRGSRAALEELSSSNDIDVIMKSMMVVPSSNDLTSGAAPRVSA